jgi:hypothetical protein
MEHQLLVYADDGNLLDKNLNLAYHEEHRLCIRN